MKGLRYILILLTFCMTAISCEREDGPRYPAEGTGRPIAFAVESEWQEITKSVVKDINDLENVGFDVLATWHKDPEDDWYYEYDNYPVFGASGTSVLFQDDSWVCTNEQEWQRGYYDFVAVVPAGGFECFQSSSFSKSKIGDKTTLEYANVLTLDLGEAGFTLSTDKSEKNQQLDLMYAFYSADNSAEQSSTVNMKFDHAFSLLDINLAIKDGGTFAQEQIFVTDVLLYGIHPTIYGQLKFRNELVAIGADNITDVTTNNIRDLLRDAPVSTSTAPFYRAEYTAGIGFPYGNNTITLIDDLLVFPETLSRSVSLKVEIKLYRSQVTKEVSVEINQGEWKPGIPNVYTLVIDPTIFTTSEFF